MERNKSSFVQRMIVLSTNIANELSLDDKCAHNLIHSAKKLSSELFDVNLDGRISEIRSNDELMCEEICFVRNKSTEFIIRVFSNQPLTFRTKCGNTEKAAKINIKTAIERLEKFLSKE